MGTLANLWRSMLQVHRLQKCCNSVADAFEIVHFVLQSGSRNVGASQALRCDGPRRRHHGVLPLEHGRLVSIRRQQRLQLLPDLLLVDLQNHKPSLNQQPITQA